MDYVDEIEEANTCYYAVIGITGVGKSQFLNALTDSQKATSSSSGNSHTQNFEIIPVGFEKKILRGVDTPGLSDSKDNKEKINKIKQLLSVFPRIQKLIVVKKYNDIRIDSGIQDALKVFMESFPLQNFWDYVIIVNTWAETDSRAFKNFKKNEFKKFSDKVNECENLKEYMQKNNIDFPQAVEEYFVDSICYKEIDGMENTFNEIKREIARGKKMFKKVEKHDVKIEVVSGNNGIDILKKTQKVIYTDFNGKKTEVTLVIGTEDQPPKNSTFKRTETKEEFIEKDKVRFYDILSLGISWAARKNLKYNIYERKVYEIDMKEVKGPWHYKYTEWRS